MGEADELISGETKKNSENESRGAEEMQRKRASRMTNEYKKSSNILENIRRLLMVMVRKLKKAVVDS